MRRFIGALMLVVFLGGCTKTVYLDENGNEIVPPQTEKVEYLHNTKYDSTLQNNQGRK